MEKRKRRPEDRKALYRRQRALPAGLADEEGAELFDVLRRLLRLAHLLDALGQRRQLLADQADDELVVVLVQAVAGDADVVGRVGRAEGHADGGVLVEDLALFGGLEDREGGLA